MTNFHDIIASFREDAIADLKAKFEYDLKNINSEILTEKEAENWMTNFVNPIVNLVNSRRIVPKPDGADGFNFDLPGEKYWLNFMPDNDEVHLWRNGSYTNWIGYHNEKSIEESDGNLGDIMRTLRNCGNFFRGNITKKKKKSIDFFLREVLKMNGFTEKDMKCVYFSC